MATDISLQTSNRQQNPQSFLNIFPSEIRLILFSMLLSKGKEIRPGPFRSYETRRQISLNAHRTEFKEVEEEDLEAKWATLFSPSFCSEPENQIQRTRKEKGSDPKTSELSLAMTCRQAYHEMTHAYYSQNHFEIESGYLLNRFVRDIPPINIQTIKRLHIIVQTRPKKDAAGYLRGFHRFSVRENRGPLSLAPIEQFHGLETLNLDINTPPKRPCKEFIEFLIAHTSGLKQLKLIVVVSNSSDVDVESYKDYRPESDQLSGWTYSVTTPKDWPQISQHLERVSGRV